MKLVPLISMPSMPSAKLSTLLVTESAYQNVPPNCDRNGVLSSIIQHYMADISLGILFMTAIHTSWDVSLFK